MVKSGLLSTRSMILSPCFLTSDRVVPSHVLAHHQQPGRLVEERGRVQAACPLEGRLGRGQARTKGVQRVQRHRQGAGHGPEIHVDRVQRRLAAQAAGGRGEEAAVEPLVERGAGAA